MGRKKYHGRRAAAFIFDLDGTLIDSGLDISNAANFARGHFGLPELPTITLIPYIGDGVGILLQRALGHETGVADDEMVEEGLAVFRDYYGRHCLDNTVLYPGVLDVLARFRSLPMMVATNKPRRYTKQILEGLHVISAFRKIVAAEDATRRKPDPAPLLACLQGLEVDPAEVVVVGDHPNDIHAARAMGAISVGVTYGMTTPGLIRSAKPNLMIASMPDLIELFPSR